LSFVNTWTFSLLLPSSWASDTFTSLSDPGILAGNAISGIAMRRQTTEKNRNPRYQAPTQTY
jgi:hypothetical protein